MQTSVRGAVGWCCPETLRTYNIVILYRRKGSPEVEVAVVDKLDMYIET